jgi:hypothetical protein
MSTQTFTSSESIRAILYCYLLAADILHAVSAELYQGEQLLLSVRPIHCDALTGQVIQMHLQSVLDLFSQHSGTRVAQFDETRNRLLTEFNCPIADCRFNLASRLEELL